ncbi:hypothetical protein LMH87_011079 [Akanthomyces muscarius]|uniref:Pentatricopeptide repeat protein n=1 Tax=Akanthomyces muscarius TaxID=2231603 RepID=A0A9W8Q909_AKAMU|nr:hypothetical protein LMH87_011079 [Akanthomyces muscarius]KAJ4150325.1 hypothetical protein LMH87_011079 [Akanthomyces muscarius]
MQSLWNRASQAHRCGCRACSTAVNAMGRRTTTAAGRRKVTFAEIFTACYSSMFASAAIIDSMRKDERRKELDKQLEEAKQELAALKEQGKLLPSLDGTNPDGLTPKQMDILWKAMKKIYNERPYRKNIRYPAAVTASSVTDCLIKDYYDCPSENRLRKGRHIDYAALERAILTESEQCTAYGARTETHLRHETSRFLSLVNALLKEADRMDRTNKKSTSFKQARDMLCNNHAGYTFRSLDPEAARNMTQKLNESLRKILATPMSPKEKIGRLCYNLMASSHVPDIHTYNTLIAGFDQYGLSALSDHVIYSFFYGRYIRPTESTFVAILNHNKLMNRPGQFLLNVARITGLDDKTGAKMRRRHQDSLQRNAEKVWAMTNRASKTRTGEYIMENMPLNTELVEEMMRGLLHFKLFEQAAVLFVGCLKSGVALGTKIIRQLLDECISALDWSASVQLLRGMSEFGQQWRELMLESGDDGLYLVDRVHVLLDVCGISTRGIASFSAANRLQISEDGLSSLMNTLDSTGILLEPSSFMYKYNSSKSRLLQLESIWKEYVKVRKVTTAIESKLLNADHTQEFREDCALHIGESALERSQKLGREFAKLMPIREQSIAKCEQARQPTKTIEQPRVSYGQRIAAAQVVGLDRDLAMQWRRQLILRPQPMAQNAELGPV